MLDRPPLPPPDGAVLVLGLSEAASAVACRLHAAAIPVALVAGAEPPLAHRRLMAFADAWFDGSAWLDGLEARRVAGPGVPLSAGFVPILDSPVAEILAAARWRALVDARLRKRAEPERWRGLAPLTIGLGPGFVAGGNVDLAIETEWGERLGAVVETGPTRPLAGEPRAIDGIGRERLVYADRPGMFRHERAIGGAVRAGAVIATLADAPIRAPLDGTLRGIVRDGVLVARATKLLEVDPRPPERAVCRGIGPRPRRIADGVAEALRRA